MNDISTWSGIAPLLGQRRTAPATALTWAILIVLMVVPLTYGNALGNLAIVLGIVALFVADRAAYAAVLGMPHIRLMIAAFASLAISIIVIGGATSESLIVFDFIPLLLAIPVSAVFVRAQISEAESKLPLLALLGAAVACSVALVQYFVLLNNRPGGWELSPIHFADLSVTLGFISVAGLMGKSTPWRPIYALGPVIGVAAGALSGTRATLMVAAALFLLSLGFMAAQKAGRHALLLGLVAIVLLVALVALGPSLGLYRALDLGQLLGAREGNDVAFGFRLEQYQAAIKAFGDAPLFGHGWRHEVQSALQYMSDAARQDYLREHWGYIHDEFLSMSVGMGIFGSLAWVLLMSYPPVAVIWARRSGGLSAASTYMVLASWLGILVGGLTDVLFKTELTKTFYCFIPNAVLLLTWRPSAVTALPAEAG